MDERMRAKGTGGREGIECGWIIRVRAPFLKLPGRKFKDEDLIFASVKTHVGKGTNQRKLQKISLLLLSTRSRSKSGRERKREKKKTADLKLLSYVERAAYSLQRRYLPP